jgi:hypothetical protein
MLYSVIFVPGLFGHTERVQVTDETSALRQEEQPSIRRQYCVVPGFCDELQRSTVFH